MRTATALEEHFFSFEVNGDKRQTSFVATGPQDGPLLIFIHGWPVIGKVWKPQLLSFAGLVFRTVAPDMPGYRNSTSEKKLEIYSLEQINLSMVELLKHLGREKAVWIGHDWGCGAVWSFAAHYPELCVGVAGLAVPYRVVELGLEELLKYVNRDIYPEDQYPYGQWSYQKYYETNFEKAVAWHDKDPEGFLKVIYQPGDTKGFGKPAAVTCNVMKDGGWFGGLEAPDPKWKHIPVENTLLDEETCRDLVASMKKTGFWGADAWYANHDRNRRYSLEKWKNDGYLHMPVLFVEATYDSICASTESISTLGGPTKKYCTDLTWRTIDCGHWVAEEKPEETNAVIAKWLVEGVKEYWPSK